MVAAGLILMTPFLLMAAWLVAAAMRGLRLLPDGVGTGAATLLLAATAGGALLLVDTYGSLVSRPAEVQKRFLGEAVAGPLSLRGFEQFGFQDPGEIWRYALPAARLAELRRRCVADRFAPNRCSLGAEADERYYASASLEGDRLRIDEGLW